MYPCKEGNMMKHFLPRLLTLTVLLACQTVTHSANAQPLVFTSPLTQATVIELFTSEGCSSCPPADRWLSRFKTDPRLWKEVIPLAFHVDYWNYLGWTDKFSKPAHSERQQIYAAKGFARSVYTPGIFSNGREWRGWFRSPQLKSASDDNVGVLRVALQSQELTATFAPAQPIDSPLQLNIAILGFDIHSPISRGENQGTVLNHDFVILNLRTQKEKSAHHWQINRDELNLSQKYARAIAVWVSASDDPTPLQATGGWLAGEANQ